MHEPFVAVHGDHSAVHAQSEFEAVDRVDRPRGALDRPGVREGTVTTNTGIVIAIVFRFGWARLATFLTAGNISLWFTAY